MSFHVFLSHSSADKPAVEEMARRLEREGIKTWLDKWHLIPGAPWQPAIENALAESETCAVFVGPSGVGPWQNEEMRALINASAIARGASASFRFFCRARCAVSAAACLHSSRQRPGSNSAIRSM